MSKFNPTMRKAPTPTYNNNSNISLVGLSTADVREACQHKLMAKSNDTLVHTGEYFLNAVTPKIFAAEEMQNGGVIMHALPQIYANFDNIVDSTGVELAEGLSNELFDTGDITDLQYYFKLIDSKTKQTIATDMPEREERETSADDLPDFLKPEPSATVAYIADPSVCAWLHIYVDSDGTAVRVATNYIAARYKPQVDVVVRHVAAGTHFQAGVVPQTAVLNWLEAEPEGFQQQA